MNIDVRNALLMIDAMTGTISTEEQLEFASNLTKPRSCFANPGTGKTHTLVNGIILAQTYYKIPGRKINAMSFTRESTAELKARYDRACAKCWIKPTATFNTFHRICRQIINEQWPGMKIVSGYDWDVDVRMLQTYMEQRDFTSEDMFYVKKVLQAIVSLNSQLCYDDIHVQSMYAFKELEMPLDIFQDLRADMFTYGVIRKKIPQGDIPIYTLYALLTNDYLRKKYKEMFQIMLVDEFQDMTKLYLVILSMISTVLIVIGDMKQQIYGFNGACPDIIAEYLKIFPDADQVELTKSFRCKNEIADYATQLYWPNDKRVKAFTGVGDGGVVNIRQDNELNIRDIVAKVKIEQDKEDRANAKTTMFLCRNNFSITPIIEELYRQNVLFRVKTFYKVMDYPIFRELSILASVAEEPTDPMRQAKALQLFPEFKGYNEYNNPLLQYLKGGKSLLSARYMYREESSVKIIEALNVARQRIREKSSAGKVFNSLWHVYDKYILEGKWWKFEHDKDFYIDLVASIVESKTFPEMVSEEWDKEKRNNDNIAANMGVQCLTIHSAKGLEANDVYILDADDNIMPNAKKISKLIQAGCEYEAAKAIREERNLLYVAVTRAKDNVTITHYDRLSPLILNPKDNEYSYLDEIYACSKNEFDDVGAFLRILNMEKLGAQAIYGATSGDEASQATTGTGVASDVLDDMALMDL